MVLFVRNLFVSCLLFEFAYGDLCTNNNPKTTEARLRKKLLCDYDKSVRPVLNRGNATVVTMRMVLKNVELVSKNFNQYSDSITVRSWMIMKWTDQHLTWNKNDYEKINNLHISSDVLWTPDLALYNAESSSVATYTTTCLVENDGTVTCIPPLTHVAMCVPDLTRWPYDTQNCSLRLGSWVHTGEEVDFRLAKNSSNVSMDGYQPNREWKLITVDVSRSEGKYNCCPDETFPSVKYHFVLERHSASHAATVVAPALVMMVLCLVTFLMEAKIAERSCLAGINLLCHFSYMQQLSWYVPYNGDTCPLAVLFFRDSMIMTCCSVVITLIVRSLTKSVSDAPAWITIVCDYAVNTRPGQLIMFYPSANQKGTSVECSSDDLSLIPNQNEKRNNWTVFACLIDRIAFIVFLLSYVIMMISLLPKSYA